jgi:hypothetical protein
MTVSLFAGIRVRDVTAARAWYERLLGEPSFFPNATEVVWTLGDGRSLYIEEDPGRAGGALITVFIDDLDAVISEIGSRGLEPAGRETYFKDSAEVGRLPSLVASERLGLEPGAFVAILENMGDADGGGDLLYPALDQLDVGVVAQAEGVQALSLGPADVTGRGIALRISVRVVPDEGLPVRVTRPFDRVSNLFPGESHGFSLPLHSA